MLKLKSILAFLSFILLLQGCASSKDPLVRQAEVTLHQAATYFHSISTNGGYAGIYSVDLNERFGESFYEEASATEIWVQPPGTPSVGECYLRAYRITGEPSYRTAAMDAARALAWGQRTHGGWDHRVDVSHMDMAAERVLRKDGRCTFDDNITQGALSFLMSMDELIDEPWLTEAIDVGLAYMMESQFENGGWPQWYPLRGGYHDYFTFNDNAINDCIGVMLKAHRIYGDPEYLETATRGGDFIILSQSPPPQSGWAQQYAHDLKPAWARSFEPPGICSAATIRNIRTLVDLYLYTRDSKYLESIQPAIAWLEKSKIGDNLWARLYEEGSNVPIYGDREDGYKVHYDYEKVSEFERTHYGWQGTYGFEEAITYYEEVLSLGIDDFLAKRDKKPTREEGKQQAAGMEPEIRSILAGIDEMGRWISEEVITCRDFVRNVNLLCSFLELSGR